MAKMHDIPKNKLVYASPNHSVGIKRRLSIQLPYQSKKNGNVKNLNCGRGSICSAMSYTLAQVENTC